MSRIITEKRSYNADKRQESAAMSSGRILLVAKKLFKKNGFEKVTIDAIAAAAKISVPTVYAKYKSKRGILFAILDNSFAEEKHGALVQKIYGTDDVHKKIHLTAKLSRLIYEAEHKAHGWLRNAGIIDPVLADLEKQMECRRYERQHKAVEHIAQSRKFNKKISLVKARDIMWAYTGRDFYRLLVAERSWSPDAYERWLATALEQALLICNIIHCK